MKLKLLSLLSLGLAFSFVGCSSTKAPAAAASTSYVKVEIVNNSDKSLRTPAWVSDSRVLTMDNGLIVFAHKMTLDGAARPDACVSMARSQAVAEMMKYIKTAVTTSGQVEELNASSDPSYSSLTAFLSQGNISGAQVTDTYWEQTMEPDETGYRPIKKLMCAVKVGVDKRVLEKQMSDAISGTPGGNPEIRAKLLDAQKSFINNVGSQNPAPAAQPLAGGNG